MIELLGVGVPRKGGWLLHRVCARIPRAKIVAVCSVERAERMALLDAITGRAIADEGRAWVSGVPVISGRTARVQELVATVDLTSPGVEGRSALWNCFARRRRLGGLDRLLRFPRESERRGALRALARVGLEGRSAELLEGFDKMDRARLAVARCLWREPEFLVVPELEVALSGLDGAASFELLRHLSRDEGVGVVVSGAPSPTMLDGVDRALVLSEGLLVFDGAASDLLRRPATKSAGRLFVTRS